MENSPIKQQPVESSNILKEQYVIKFSLILENLLQLLILIIERGGKKPCDHLIKCWIGICQYPFLIEQKLLAK